MTYVTHRHQLSSQLVDKIQSLTPVFDYGEFGKLVFYRTYSRDKEGGGKESWNDVVIRVMSGVLSVRKDWYLKHNLMWDEDYWNHYATGMALDMFYMKWLPPGRGLWAMGSDFVYDRGSMALQNCGFTNVTDNIGNDAHWAMDALMCGVGVGFTPERNDSLAIHEPRNKPVTFVIPDTREGWCDSVRAKINSWLTPNSNEVIFDYSVIRPEGTPIKGFGGLASGPAPLKYLHGCIDKFFTLFMEDKYYDSVLLKADIINAIGCCVVAGNVRRSAEICCGDINDETFLNLKDYNVYPHRQEIGWMSNNSACLEYAEDFERLDEIGRRVVTHGEPGIINLKNIKRGRIGVLDDNLKVDRARGFNPCGEQPLEDKELCTLVETCPTKCSDKNEWLKACEYATVYASTVTLLHTHRPETNAVMFRNRRIGVGIIDYTGWVHKTGVSKVISSLREGYKRVRDVNRHVNGDAGVPESIRVTTVKPGGTVPKMVGRVSGCNYPTSYYQIRRIRVAENSPMVPLLKKANIPYEKDVASANTLVFEYPLFVNTGAKEAYDVSIWEQAFNIITLQREWSDNAVSNTINFKPKWALVKSVPVDGNLIATVKGLNINIDVELFIESGRESYTKNNEVMLKVVNEYGTKKLNIYVYDPKHEEDDLPSVLSLITPHIKSASFLPLTRDGVYPQMPESAITIEEYNKRINNITSIDWSELYSSEVTPEIYCTGAACERPQ